MSDASFKSGAMDREPTAGKNETEGDRYVVVARVMG
jgi:hypothetical protein